MTGLVRPKSGKTGKTAPQSYRQKPKPAIADNQNWSIQGNAGQTHGPIPPVICLSFANRKPADFRSSLFVIVSKTLLHAFTGNVSLSNCKADFVPTFTA